MSGCIAPGPRTPSPTSSVQPEHDRRTGRNRVKTFSSSAHRAMWVSAVSITRAEPADPPQRSRCPSRSAPASARRPRRQRATPATITGSPASPRWSTWPGRTSARCPATNSRTPRARPRRSDLVGPRPEPPTLHGVDVERLLDRPRAARRTCSAGRRASTSVPSWNSPRQQRLLVREQLVRRPSPSRISVQSGLPNHPSFGISSIIR